ncbi:hypothetical protein Acj133p047 [Acinetobacter phage 133]|uniref:Uncharacterized protein n=1 Tax=Acinetobacter phage 133 TaxID=2919552 RepID=D9I613_9CAUD|nr:hypothetical protein Acj133p047 [Acinetobacter phage 133]ADJ19394.1 hypothetical protein Acj133p047 [Acinetobacter phage 133]
MDILEKYKLSRAALTEVTKKLFFLLEDNDVYKIIQHHELANVEILDTDQMDIVEVRLYNFKDVSPKIAFMCSRDAALNVDDSIIPIWLETSKEAMEKINAALVLKFLKAFSVKDHPLLAMTIQAVPELIHLEQADSEIGNLMARYMSEKLLEQSKTIKK